MQGKSIEKREGEERRDVGERTGPAGVLDELNRFVAGWKPAVEVTDKLAIAKELARQIVAL